MFVPLLHREPVAVDSNSQRELRLRHLPGNWAMAENLHAVFVTAQDFASVAREYPIVFVNGNDVDGNPAVMPLALLGLTTGVNLFLEGGEWRARQLPHLLRLYPFFLARLEGNRFAVGVDRGWQGLGTEGERLYTEAGEPAPLLQKARADLEGFQAQVEQTRAFCKRLVELELLETKQLDLNLPDGQKQTVATFLGLNEAALAALPDERIVELQRSGALGLLYAHIVSIGNLNKLAEWHAQRTGAAPGSAA